LESKIGGNIMMVKRVSHNGSRSSLNEVILEYAFYKLCSMLGVGPQIALRTNLELICYEDCAEFLMEKCEPFTTELIKEQQQARNLGRDIRECVKTLHSEGVMHLDIKPQNILYSWKQGRFVLTDFGISKYTDTLPGQG